MVLILIQEKTYSSYLDQYFCSTIKFLVINIIIERNRVFHKVFNIRYSERYPSASIDVKHLILQMKCDITYDLFL